MALKRKITKAVFDALSEDFQKEYKADGMDYVLDVEGFEDTGELKRAKDRLAEEKKEEKAKREAAEARVAELERLNSGDDEASARKRGDIAALEKAWQAKIDAEAAKGTSAAAALTAQLTRRLVDDTAANMAARLSEKPALLLPHIKARLQADFTGDEPVTRVLGADGKLSALTVAELEKEFVANEDFAAIITGSKASGGGASGGRQSGGSAPKKLAEMNDAERIAYAKTNPAAFEKESTALRTGPGAVVI